MRKLAEKDTNLALVKKRVKKLNAPSLDEASFTKSLKKGDIISAGWKDSAKPGFIRKTFYNLSKKIQGTPYTHTAVYAGNGKVYEIERIDGRATVRAIPLSQMFKKNKLRADRPGVSKATKDKALKYIESRMGQSVSGSRFVLNAARTSFGADKSDKKIPTDQLICSNLIADAYKQSGKKLSNRPTRIVRPVDLAASNQTTLVAKYANIGMVGASPFTQSMARSGASYKEGGTVEKTGPALVHKGEKVIPVDRVKKINRALKLRDDMTPEERAKKLRQIRHYWKLKKGK